MHQEALITSPLGVGAVVTLVIWFSFWLDKKFRFFSFLGTAILVITGGAILANLYVIPSSLADDSGQLNPVYQFAGDYGVPLAIVLLLLSADFRNLRQLGKPAMIAFLLAMSGTVCGAVLGGILTADRMGEEAWKITGQFAASYIGGGINYAAVGNAFQTSETMYATGAAADNIMTNVWMVGTAVLPVLLRRFYPSIRDRHEKPDQPAGNFREPKMVTIHDLVTLLAASFTIVAVAEWMTPWINQALGWEIPSVIWYTTIALLAAWFTPLSRFQGSAEIGNFLLHLFFATMGTGTILSTLVNRGPVVFLFLVLLVGTHALIVFGAGRWLKLEVEILSVASQAAVGGPSTALALTTSKGWTSLITPSVIMGLSGYAVGNYIGVFIGSWMQMIL
ncbi:DUF819 family protein [Thermoactinomyces mirandus]|uniref:DUF819 family protein n=1 Tax=Thermoactinomyces mirandus TaxID=2756294 RepID=A0A7W1XQC7_9BACL|nr:DUF819 family protein [Thermoactinomyces mirandus]MBA4601211.1 DUF819 family protein [Thermoactinomyces mirandus]